MSSYDLVAEEYYDRDLHPTCANLRDASDAGLDAALADFLQPAGSFLELGVGSSTLLSHQGFASRQVVGLDLNPNMLRMSRGRLVCADAHHLPFREDTFCGVFGSLVDPFNADTMYREAQRVLTRGGNFLFTVPDVRWVRHNQKSSKLPEHTAAITLRDGEIVLLPSRVLEYEEQEAALLNAGFNQVERRQVRLDFIPPAELSPRFLGADGRPAFTDIVTAYLARLQ